MPPTSQPHFNQTENHLRIITNHLIIKSSVRKSVSDICDDNIKIVANFFPSVGYGNVIYFIIYVNLTPFNERNTCVWARRAEDWFSIFICSGLVVWTVFQSERKVRLIESPRFRFYWVKLLWGKNLTRWAIKAFIDGDAECFKFASPSWLPDPLSSPGFRYQMRRQLSHCWKCWCWQGLAQKGVGRCKEPFSRFPLNRHRKKVTLIFLPSTTHQLVSIFLHFHDALFVWELQLAAWEMNLNYKKWHSEFMAFYFKPQLVLTVVLYHYGCNSFLRVATERKLSFFSADKFRCDGFVI